MKLEPDSLPFGVAPGILIDCAKQLRHRPDPFSAEDFCRALGAPRDEALLVLHQLRDAGFLQEDSAHPGLYAGTAKLSQLGAANITQGISRADAEKLLVQVIRKAESVNATPRDFAYGVRCIVVFGSFLTETAVLGDLDLGVRLHLARPIDYGGADRSHRELAEKTYIALRLRKPKIISLHAVEEVMAMGTPYKVVFGSLEKS